MTSRVFGIVLAGGASSRFGTDKLAATIGGRPLLHHVLDAVASVADHVVLVLAPGAAVPSLPPSVLGRITVARDAELQAGPLAGLVAGLQAVAAADRDDPGAIALVVGGDMPWLVPGVLRLLVETLETMPERTVAVTLEAPDPAPLPMAIRMTARAPAADLLNGRRRSLRALLEAIPTGTVEAMRWRSIDPDGRTLRDVDTPADLDPPVPGRLDGGLA